MSKTKHTPWKFDHDNHGRSEAWGWGLLDADGASLGVTVYQTRSVIDNRDLETVEHAVERARRIVSAVNSHDELLAACRAFVDWFCLSRRPDDLANIERQAIAAIAKAESL